MSNYLDNLVKCFNNSKLGVNLTTVLIDDEPWFIAKEVASALEYSNTKDAINNHVDELDQKMLSCSECKELFGNLLKVDEAIEDSERSFQLSVGSEQNLKGSALLPLKEGISISNRGMKLINESGLYTLIARSDKPEAKPFRRWVTSEVLPSIRKTGSYGESISKEERLMLDVLKADTREAKLVALDALEQHHKEEKRALEAKNTELEEQLDEANTNIIRLEAEREVALKGLYHPKKVAEVIKIKYNIKYVLNTIRQRATKALKQIALELGESIYEVPNKINATYHPSLYFTKRAVDQLFKYIEQDSGYFKKIK